MNRLVRPAFVILLVALPLAAQEKKTEAKDSTPKKDDKKTSVPAGGKYHVVNHIVGRLTNSDNSELLVEVEVRVPSSRSSGRNEKITFKMASDVKVRTLKMPEKTDDKGKAIPYTPQEKAKLRGDPKLPGYAADLNSLKSGQVVELELSTTKPPNSLSKKSEDEEKPFVTMIVINEEAPQKIEKKKK